MEINILSFSILLLVLSVRAANITNTSNVPISYFTPYYNVKFAVTTLNNSWARLDAEVPENSFLALLFSNRANFGNQIVDLVQFNAYTSTGQIEVLDMYTDGTRPPRKDSTNNYVNTTVVINSNQTVSFTTYRPLNTGDP